MQNELSSYALITHTGARIVTDTSPTTAHVPDTPSKLPRNSTKSKGLFRPTILNKRAIVQEGLFRMEVAP
jgi:hypothetical protein